MSVVCAGSRQPLYRDGVRPHSGIGAARWPIPGQAHRHGCGAAGQCGQGFQCHPTFRCRTPVAAAESPVSPRDGVPLVGPNAVPEDQWPALHGAYVAAQLKGESRLFIQEQTDFRGLKLTSRVILARLSHPTLWALSRDHFSGLQTLPFGQSRALSDEEKAWLSADAFKGRLYFLSGFSSGGLDGAKIKQLYSQAGGQASDLDTAWLIVEIERNAVPVFGGGWNVYAPFTDSDTQVWLQWPLPDAQSRLEDNGSVTMLPDDVDLSQLKPEFEGVWLAPGSHHFAPPGAAPGTVGLLIADARSDCGLGGRTVERALGPDSPISRLWFSGIGGADRSRWPCAQTLFQVRDTGFSQALCGLYPADLAVGPVRSDQRRDIGARHCPRRICRAYAHSR